MAMAMRMAVRNTSVKRAAPPAAAASRTVRYHPRSVRNTRVVTMAAASSSFCAGDVARTMMATGVTAPKAPKAASRVVVTESKYKMKTKRAAAKRFRVTSNGKVVMRKPFKGHLLGHKSSNRKRRLSRFETAKRCDRNLLRKMLPYDGVKCLNK
ncbi:ribosomal protein L35 [Pycnococcus provasolii]